MNYKRIYDSLMLSGYADKPNSGYYERHHIIPKSLGGSDSKENLVYLTGRQHYIAHVLLMKIHKNREMAYAYYLMRNPNHGDYTIKSSRAFEEARLLISVDFSKNNPMNSPEVKEAIRLKLVEYHNKPEVKTASSRKAFLQHGEFGDTKEKPKVVKRKGISERLLKSHHLAKQVNTPHGVFHSARRAAAFYSVCHKSILRRINSPHADYKEYFYLPAENNELS